MASGKRSIERTLSSRPVQIVSEDMLVRARRRTLLLLVLAAACGAVAYHYATLPLRAEQLDQYLQEARLEREEIHAALKGVRTDLDIATATREELEGKVQALTERNQQLREELEFVKAAAADDAK
ncbi:MAG TPA: hypothetical protein VKY38_08720 [Azoarcus sp.]|nr:hypothetical protein [Azoarcus sp.]